MNLASLLSKWVDWLADRKAINILLVGLYFIFIFFMHNPVVKLSVFVMHALSLPVYNKVVIVISLLILALYMWFLITGLKNYRDNRAHKILYLLVTLCFVIIHFNIMFEMNIEIIHVFEYSILAFLLLPLTRRFGAALAFAVPFMLLDEWNQYVVLYPGYVEYFEFNDVVMDIYGTALTLIMLYIAGVRGEENIKPLWKRPEFALLVAGLLVTAALIKSCIVCYYPADKCPNTQLVLNTMHEAPVFWHKFKNRDVIYHIMQPTESIITISAFIVFYFGLDSLRKPVHAGK